MGLKDFYMFAGVRELLKPGNEANLKGKLGGKRVALEAATFLLDATKAHAHLSARAKQIYDALTNQAALDAQLAHKIAECAVEAVMEFLRVTYSSLKDIAPRGKPRTRSR